MENTFFIIGAQRSGTTSLANALDAHPEIEIAKPFLPEPKFFLSDEEYLKGKEYYKSKYFGNKKSAHVYGEKSTSYIESENAAVRIKRMFPEARIIAVLRNPVERALSNYFFSRQNGIETRSPEEVFIRNIPAPRRGDKYSVSPFDYLARGEYLMFLHKYEALFGRGNMLLMIFEHMIADLKWMDSVSTFLQVKQIPNLSPSLHLNASDKAVQISKEVRERLKDYFRTHIESLENYFHLDLTLWKN